MPTHTLPPPPVSAGPPPGTAAYFDWLIGLEEARRGLQQDPRAA